MRVLFVTSITLLSLITACTSTSLATPTLSDSDSLCNSWLLPENDGFCLQVNDNSLFIQSSTEQITANNYEMSLVVDGTTFIEMSDTIRIVALEGRAFIGAQGQNRMLSAGREVTIPIIESIAQHPSEITVISSNFGMQIEYLNALPCPIEVITLIPTLTPEIVTISTISRDVCTVVIHGADNISSKRVIP